MRGSVAASGCLTSCLGMGPGPTRPLSAEGGTRPAGCVAARYSVLADSVWTKRGCRKRPCGQAGGNSRQARCESAGTKKRELPPTCPHSSTLCPHSAALAPLLAENACGATTVFLFFLVAGRLYGEARVRAQNTSAEAPE